MYYFSLELLVFRIEVLSQILQKINKTAWNSAKIKDHSNFANMAKLLVNLITFCKRKV